MSLFSTYNDIKLININRPLYRMVERFVFQEFGTPPKYIDLQAGQTYFYGLMFSQHVPGYTMPQEFQKGVYKARIFA